MSIIIHKITVFFNTQAIYKVCFEVVSAFQACIYIKQLYSLQIYGYVIYVCCGSQNKQGSFNKNKTNSGAFSPQANYTDWATAICRRIIMPSSVDRGVSRGQRGGSPTVVNLSFLDRSRYFSF
jgi:hypothetical protein